MLQAPSTWCAHIALQQHTHTPLCRSSDRSIHAVCNSDEGNNSLAGSSLCLGRSAHNGTCKHVRRCRQKPPLSVRYPKPLPQLPRQQHHNRSRHLSHETRRRHAAACSAICPSFQTCTSHCCCSQDHISCPTRRLLCSNAVSPQEK